MTTYTRNKKWTDAGQEVNRRRNAIRMALQQFARRG